MYKENLALNNQQGLYTIKPNQIKTIRVLIEWLVSTARQTRYFMYHTFIIFVFLKNLF